jgi:outer membrane protein assembly factor BamB
MFHGDRRHSGYSIADAPFDSILAWSVPSTDSIYYSSPVIGPDLTIYVGNVAEELQAFSPFGEPLWTFTAGGNFRHSTPAVADDGTIYIGSADGKLYAVNADGTFKWTFTAGASIKTSPNIATDGTVYFGADDGRLYAVNPDSTLRWTYATGDSIRSSPAIGPDGTIFFGSMDHYLYALRSNGTLRWRALTGGIIKYCSPAVDEAGNVYFGSYDGFLYALTSNQEFLWAYFVDDEVRSSPAIGPDGTVYIGGGNQLLAIGPGGTLDWDFGTGGPVLSSPVYFGDDDVIGIGSEDGVFYAVHADGSEDWSFTVGTPIRATAAPGLVGNVYVADLSGTLWALGNVLVGAGDPGGGGRRLPLIASPNPAPGRVGFRAAGGDPLHSALLLFDASGRLIRRLGGDGTGSFVWDGMDQGGRPATSGVYLYRLEGSAGTGRVTLLR